MEAASIAPAANGALGEAPAQPARKTRLKLNPELLLSDRGFRYLRTHANQIQFKGPGHEVEDLDSLMLFYREWSHYLFPESKFTDFVTKVRKECSSKLMKQYLHDLYRNGSDQFAEVDAGLSEIRELFNPVQPNVSNEAVEEVEEGVDFEDFDFDEFSEDERLMRELEIE